MANGEQQNELLDSSGEPTKQMPEVSIEELLKYIPGKSIEDISEIVVKPSVMSHIFVSATAIFSKIWHK